ncbi:MAG: tRNA (adenosine(37)-N6)-threonylcarbamoyltransferase complex dimerization subunit type 1 TsaB [Planctomycetota bacterium]
MILLIDHSTPQGQVGLADRDRLIDTLPIPPRKRHNVDLMVAVNELCAKHDVKPDDLSAVFLTLGPGSFTGLRVAVATAKMLALTSPREDFRVVGIPNLDLLHHQHPQVLIALNIKRGTAWSVGPDELELVPAFRSLADIKRLGFEHQIPLIAEKLEHASTPHPGLHGLLELASRRLRNNDADDPLTLAPAYLREPEAVTLWNEKEARQRDRP